MTEDIEAMKKSVLKAMQIEAITNTYTEMLAKHPEQKEMLDKILNSKLVSLK